MQTNYVSALVTWNNADVVPSAVAQTLMDALSGTHWRVAPIITPPPNCRACTVTVTIPKQGATAGTNLISIELESPTGTTTEDITTLVTAAISGLNNGTVGVNQKWPTMGTVTIVSITVN